MMPEIYFLYLLLCTPTIAGDNSQQLILWKFDTQILDITFLEDLVADIFYYEFFVQFWSDN